MRHLLALTAISLYPLGAQACPRCAPAVRASVFDAGFLPTLALLLAPLLLIGLLAWALHRVGARP